ncbi:tryptophan-rich sensory protein [bacterium]|nr:tryptophan-rich sensory protein [bacterium]
MHALLWLACVAAPLIISLLVYGVRARVDGRTWLHSMNESPFAPDPAAHAVIWTLLYLLVGIAFGWFLHACLEKFGARSVQLNQKNQFVWFTTAAAAVILCTIALVLNHDYLTAFFQKHKLHQSQHTLHWLLVCSVLGTACVTVCSPFAGALLTPYLAYLLVTYRCHQYLLANN